MLEHELFTRVDSNPIISPSDLPYPCDCVCNPAAHIVDGEVLLLLRVIDQEGSSHITVARSKDGIGDWRIETTPLLHPGDMDLPFETYGCEDPRLVYLEDRGEYAITYTGYSPLGAGVCIATTKDFQTTQRFGLVSGSEQQGRRPVPAKDRRANTGCSTDPRSAPLSISG